MNMQTFGLFPTLMSIPNYNAILMNIPRPWQIRGLERNEAQRFDFRGQLCAPLRSARS